jgi:hypothetical protein
MSNDEMWHALDELAALRAWRERVMPLLAAMALGHTSESLASQARALLAESEASDERD